MRQRPATDLSPALPRRARVHPQVAESLYRYAPFGVLAVDREGRILSVNDTAARLLGYAAEEMDHEPAARFFRAPRGEGHVLPGACAEPEEAREVEVATRSGDALPVSLRLLPLETDSGKLGGTVALFVDLRGEKAREEQWRRRDRLTSLGALAAGVAHEIRNPLAGIGTSAQILKRRLPSGDPRTSFADLILEEVVRLDRIVESLLQFARPAAPRLTRQSLLPALDKAMTLVRELAVRQDVKLDVDRAERVPEIYVDADQILQVLLNVLMNAIQALHRGGEIRVSARATRKRMVERSALGRRATDRLESSRRVPDQDVLEITIRDNGPGIPAAALARVFDPFFTTRAQGSGLGLSICQTIVREHGGSIGIESTVGQGTTVTIDLPLEKRHGDRRSDPR
ncbi:MAG TPA: ATP-binding protein [Candidatus Limnocylindrales bacterium]|nr:ATP-binding protein [Candidatus Limnocylindrales bacterium]